MRWYQPGPVSSGGTSVTLEQVRISGFRPTSPTIRRLPADRQQTQQYPDRRQQSSGASPLISTRRRARPSAQHPGRPAVVGLPRERALTLNWYHLIRRHRVELVHAPEHTPIADAPVFVTHDAVGRQPCRSAPRGRAEEVDSDETVTTVVSGVPKGASPQSRKHHGDGCRHRLHDWTIPDRTTSRH